MKLYNTPAREVQDFVPQDPNYVKVYTCGPTVYSKQHIGNYTAYIYWDTLIRVLKLANYTPYRVMNITDVGHLVSDEDYGEDKMEKGARQSGRTVWEVAQFYLDDYMEHFNALNLTYPDMVARATDYIPQSTDLVDTLTVKGFTYEIRDGVYYDTTKFPTYANFAHLDLEGLQGGARVELIDDKRNISDFALWKFIQPGEAHTMRWDYLDKPGYPGWHLECSAIIHAELGETIDIHTGGIDHIQVHHTNEIAQSEAAYERPLANYWLHNSHITVDSEKISKSLGNTITFEDLADKGFTHTDYRMWVLEGHYQSQRNFTYDNITAAHNRLTNYRNWAALRHQNKEIKQEIIDQAVLKATEALFDNLNTAQALSEIDKIINTTAPTEAALQFMDEALGLKLIDTTPDIIADQKTSLQERAKAREAKDWAKSDQIREEFVQSGITILDSADGQTWQYI